jgi:Domain of unknown function (DUF4352)
VIDKLIIFWLVALGLFIAAIFIDKKVTPKNPESPTKLSQPALAITTPVVAPVIVKRPAIGDTFLLNKLEIQITQAIEMPWIGEQPNQTKASDGGIYVAVMFNYWNTSNKPLDFLSRPNIRLKTSDGVIYNPDIQASMLLALQTNVDEKAISDLNPGVRVSGVRVFEVSRSMFNRAEWKINVERSNSVDVIFN